MLPYVRHGIQFTQVDQINGELRVTGEDHAGLLLWAAQWLDEHREYAINAIRLVNPINESDDDDDFDPTVTVMIDLTSQGQPNEETGRPRLGPWTHGVPPMPL